MNLLDLKNLVAFWVDDLNFGYFTEAQVTRFLNNALKEIQKLLVLSGTNRYLKCVETPTVDEDCGTYQLPDDFLVLHRLEIESNDSSIIPKQIPSITLNQKGLLPSTAGDPAVFYLKKNQIVLIPPPAVSGNILRLFYSYRIVELSQNTEVPDIPEEYEEAIAIWAAYDCFIKDDRDPSNLLAKKNEYLKLMKEMSEQRKVDKPRSIVVTEEGGGFYW